MKFLLALLNSTLINTYYSLNFSNKSDLTVNISNTYLEELPIYPATSEQQQPFIKKADQMLQLNQQLQEEMNGFKQWIQRNSMLINFQKSWKSIMSYLKDEFIDELRKKKVDIKSRKNREYLEREFNESLAIIKPLLKEIEETDNEIDQMVYELYGLTDDEIKIIERDVI